MVLLKSRRSRPATPHSIGVPATSLPSQSGKAKVVENHLVMAAMDFTWNGAIATWATIGWRNRLHPPAVSESLG